MDSTTNKQTTITITYPEQDLLNKAAALITEAMELKDSSSVNKFEYLFQQIDSVKRLQLLQALGNLMYLDTWDNLLIESHKSAWKMEYKFKYPPG